MTSKKILINKSVDEKLEICDAISLRNKFTIDDFTLLGMLSEDKNGEIRAMVAEILVLSDSIRAEEILIRLLKDEDELVRVNAVDSLCNSKSLKVLNLLKEMILKDKSSLVRGYAILSVADIATNINYDKKELSIFFSCILEKEKVVWIKINLLQVMYMLGNESCLEILINEINNRLYRNRCAVVNTLSEIISPKNATMIKSALNKRLKIEKTFAVKSCIEKVLQSLI